MTSFDPNHVLRHIHNLYNAPHPETNAWLTAFVEHNDSAVWQVLLQILTAPAESPVTDSARFFAAQGLILRVKSQWSNCNLSVQQQLLPSIFQMLTTTTPTLLLGRRLVLLLCHLLLRMGMTTAWATPFDDVCRTSWNSTLMRVPAPED
jgi:hypothetical protein